MASVISAAHFHSEEAAYAFVEERLWPNGPICPHCGATAGHVGKLTGKSTRIGVRKCYACRKPFTVKVGTVFEASHVKLHIWLQAMHLLSSSKKGISANQLHRILGVSLQTAWFLAHRVREAMTDLHIDSPTPMGGEGKFIEADETYIGGKEANKHASKRRIKHRKMGGSEGKVAAFALVERGGRVRSYHLPVVNSENIREVLFAHVSRASSLVTDEAGFYKKVGRAFASHETVNHRAKEYVRGDAHTNSAENFFSILKRGITGCYFHVSQEHLHRYLAEFDFRYSNRIKLGVDDVTRTDRIVKGVVGKRLTYRTARGSRVAEADTE